MDGLLLNLTQDVFRKHQASPDVVEILAGQDTTSDVEDVGHSDTAQEWVSKYMHSLVRATRGAVAVRCPQERRQQSTTNVAHHHQLGKDTEKRRYRATGSTSRKC